mmetsp:Transcript_24967/g.62290  ORF Transcript_24967/g.62290 Transcript_24967/m.62290 type:complete len:412 (+) Transcript_24967:1325-2560(+)
MLVVARPAASISAWTLSIAGAASYRVQKRCTRGSSNHPMTVGTGLTRALSRKLGNATSASHRSASAHSPSVTSPVGELSATNCSTCGSTVTPVWYWFGPSPSVAAASSTRPISSWHTARSTPTDSDSASSPEASSCASIWSASTNSMGRRSLKPVTMCANADWYTSSVSARTWSGASTKRSTASAEVRCRFTSCTYALRSASAASPSAHMTERSARIPSLRSSARSSGSASSSMTYAGAISSSVRFMVSWSSREKLAPASATRMDDAISRSSHPSPTRGGVDVSAMWLSSQCASAADSVMSRRAARSFTAARHWGAYSMTASCSPASCISASAPPSCDAGTGVSRPFFRSDSCSVLSCPSLITCAAASTRSARAAMHRSLKPSTSSRCMTAEYAASMAAGAERAGDKFRMV